MTGHPAAFLDLPGGARALVFDEIDSTNQEALRRIRVGEGQNGLWITAKTQTSGRGRRGREWLSARGNFFASVLVKLRIPLARASELSFVAALAAGQSITELIANKGCVSFKWPNDILIDGKKAAGILIESESGLKSKENWVVAGIGINISSAPEEVRYPATFLNNYISDKINENKMLELLSKAWIRSLAVLDEEGFGVVRKLWLNKAEGLAREICVRVGDDDYKGTFEGLGEGGELVLRLADGKKMEIIAGDVTELNL